MLKITKEQFLFILLLYQFILINTEDIEDLKLAIASQIESLNSNSNIQNLLKDGGIFNCDSTYCSQISLISGQSKKNQIQKFPQINFINDDSNQYIITKIFLKHNFPLDSTNYKSGIKGISDIIYTKFYSYEENEISLTSINHSTFANNLLVYLPLYISDSLWSNPRFWIDNWFAILDIMLVMQMFCGIIIDTYLSQRENNRKIEKDKNNKCFICGLNKTELNNIIQASLDFMSILN